VFLSLAAKGAHRPKIPALSLAGPQLDRPIFITHRKHRRLALPALLCFPQHLQILAKLSPAYCCTTLCLHTLRPDRNNIAAVVAWTSVRWSFALWSSAIWRCCCQPTVVLAFALGLLVKRRSESTNLLSTHTLTLFDTRNNLRSFDKTDRYYNRLIRFIQTLDGYTRHDYLIQQNHSLRCEHYLLLQTTKSL
jgi:hypothetical protein